MIDAPMIHVLVLILSLLHVTIPQTTVQLHGAGASFPAEVYKSWLNIYKSWRAEVNVGLDHGARKNKGRVGIFERGDLFIWKARELGDLFNVKTEKWVTFLTGKQENG